MLSFATCLNTLDGFLYLPIVDLSAMRSRPNEVRPALSQEFGEGVEKRQARVSLNEEKLPALIYLKKDKLSFGSNHEIKASENETQTREHLAATVREVLGNVAGLDPELMVGPSPVDPAALRLLREHLGAEDLATDHRDPQLMVLGNELLVDSRNGT